MPAECVSLAHSETVHWRRCCILVSEARQAQEGKAQCSPALGQAPGHCFFPGAPQCSQRQFGSFSINLLVPGLKTQTPFPSGQWAGVSSVWQSGQVGFALKRCQYVTGRFSQVQREPESLSITFNSVLVWLETQRWKFKPPCRKCLPFLLHYIFSPLGGKLASGQDKLHCCLRQAGVLPGHLLSNFLLFHLYDFHGMFLTQLYIVLEKAAPAKSWGCCEPGLWGSWKGALCLEACILGLLNFGSSLKDLYFLFKNTSKSRVISDTYQGALLAAMTILAFSVPAILRDEPEWHITRMMAVDKSDESERRIWAFILFSTQNSVQYFF